MNSPGDPELKRLLHSGTSSVRADIVIELRKGGEHAFHQLAGRCVAIGSVADRSEIPKDFRCERNVKWS